MRHLDTIHWLALRMDDLLNSLLEYSRLGRADLRMTTVSLDDVVDDIEEILGAASPKPTCSYAVRCGWAPFPVTGSGCRKCWSIWSATLSSRRADPPRWVEVGCEDAVPPGAEQPLRAFYVRDNGIGIGAEQQETSSTRAARASRRRRGRWLTISRRIVERHGGQLWVRSAPGLGATFYFTL